MSKTLETISDCDFGFLELNPHRASTILFIHGALSCHIESSLVTPYLSDYHILIPSLHRNVKNLNPRPRFSAEHVYAHLAILVRNKAKNAQVHIYGHSMGAHLAVNFAMEHPDLVATVIASGITLFSQWPWLARAAVPQILYAQVIVPRWLPVKRGAQIFNAMVKPADETLVMEWMAEPVDYDWSTAREISTSLNDSLAKDKPVNVQARTLIVAGTATLGDTVAAVKWVVDEINKAGGQARGIEIKEGGHPWLLQLPELCAELIKAWIKGEELPNGASRVD